MPNNLAELFRDKVGLNDPSFAKSSVEAFKNIDDRLMRADFEVQVKTERGEQVFPKPGRDDVDTFPNQPRYWANHPYYQNKARLNNYETLAQVNFLTISKDGISHDFPVRIEQPEPSLLRKGLASLGLASNDPEKQRPVVVLTGLDGAERAFQTTETRYDKSGWDYADSTIPITEFLVGELAEKARMVAATPQRPQFAGMAP